MDMDRYFDIPFKENGRGPDGCDCWGLVSLFYKTEYGIDLQDMSGQYSGIRDAETIRALAEQERASWLEVNGERRPGDVVEIPLTRNHFHVGIVTPGGHILHIEEGGHARLVPERSQRIRRRIRRAWRHRELA